MKYENEIYIFQVLIELFKNSPKSDNPKFYVINPKSMTHEHLYGKLDSKTGEWIDGIPLYKIFFFIYLMNKFILL